MHLTCSFSYTSVERGIYVNRAGLRPITVKYLFSEIDIPSYFSSFYLQRDLQLFPRYYRAFLRSLQREEYQLQNAERLPQDHGLAQTSSTLDYGISAVLQEFLPPSGNLWHGLGDHE